MRRSALCWVLGCVALVACGRAWAADDETLTAKGLAKVGSVYALTDEKPVLDTVKTLRTEKRKADMETRQRQAADAKVAANKKTIDDAAREYEDLANRIEKVKDVTAHNRMVTRMNLLVTKAKDAAADHKKLEEAASKIGSEAKTKFVDDLLELSPKADALEEKYKELAADADVKAALAKLNAAASPKLAVGPSPEMVAALADLKKWRSEVDSEAIPLRERGGVQHVDVLLNGERQEMVVDTGASTVTIPFDLAEKLKIAPGEQAPTIKMRLADGNIIEGKLTVLKTVRVGRFTVENVSCIVLQKGLSDPPVILGDSFLAHFVVKLNQRAGELHLTELKDEKKTSTPGRPVLEVPAGGAGN